MQKEYKPVYPDMKLYEEILFLTTWSKTKYCVENVIGYYEPLVKPQQCENHYFWTNFKIVDRGKRERGIRTQTIEEKEKIRGFNVSSLEESNKFKEKILNNCVLPELGKFIFDCAFKLRQEKIITIPTSGT
jgi:DNA (cytosine-5)-methyltransferase 1